MDMIEERVARALFQRDVEEDVCDGTWEDNVALHDRILADARAAIEAMQEPKWLQLSGARLAQWEREGRLADLTNSVTAGLRNYFEKRAGESKNWVRSRDGAECVRVNDPICLDEIGAYVVAELSGVKLDDLIGEDFEAEF